MRQQAFEDRYAAQWEVLERWLEQRDKRKTREDAAALDPAELPQRYRRLCQQLALARDRRYGTHVVERLHRLASEIHQVLYGARSEQRSRWLTYFAGDFARIVRGEWRVVLAASLLFVLPLLVTGVVAWRVPDAVLYVLPPQNIAGFDEMYGKGVEKLGRREADTDFAMFGHYIFNNVRIAFQTFAGGLLGGLGSVFFLLFNGVVIGAVAGYIATQGYHVSFYSFVSGHSALELTAIVLSGAAGLKLGAALIAPGNLTRKQSLVAAGRRAAGLMYGVAVMLFAAAFVEAFWSPRSGVPPEIKYGVGLTAWGFVIAYFVFAGRDRAA